MKLTKEQFVENVISAAKSIDIDISLEQANKLYMYKEMLVEWNERINLTAITDDEEIIVKHIIDSLYVVKFINEGSKIIDVGTGAGLPGIIIAIYFEGKVEITLFDALNKRIIFLQDVINKLDLKNVIALHGRAEETAKDSNYREKYDIVLSRAVARLNVLMELTSPFTKVNGKCMYLKAEKAEEEMAEVKRAVSELKLKYNDRYDYTLKLNSEEMNRTILEYIKTENIREKYPRQFAKIKKTPL